MWVVVIPCCLSICKSTSSSTVVEYLSSLFCLLVFPSWVHSNRGAVFVRQETRAFVTETGIAFDTSTPYNPKGKVLCKQGNPTVWQTVKFLLHDENLPKVQWEIVLSEVLHAERPLVCIALNEMLHEHLFQFSIRAMTRTSLHSWLLSLGTVL